MAFKTLFSLALLLLHCSPTVAAQSVNPPSCSSSCSTLSAALPDLVYATNGSQYQSSIASYWSIQEQELEPACFVAPKSSSEVSVAIKILSSNQECQFAIKSGGHTPFPGAANIHSGVTLDLAGLDAVDINRNSGTVSVGSGNNWGHVYTILQEAGFTIPGGRDSGVGVGGLVLGGGLSFFGGRVGFVCDSVTNFEVVLASGEIINANETSNEDLFRALKGGSNNFGVVTAFEFPLFETNMWGGFLFTDISFRETSSSYFENFTRSDTYDEHAALIHSEYFTGGGWLLSIHMAYTQPVVTSPSVFDPLLSLPGQSTVRPATHLDLAGEFEAVDPVNPRAMWITMTMKNNAAFMETAFQLANATAMELADMENFDLAISFQPLPQTMIQRAANSGGNMLGLDQEDGDLVIVNVGAFWQDATDDPRIYETIWDLNADIEAEAKQRGVWNEYKYLNYAIRHHNQTQDVMASYGEDNLAKLRAVSNEHDPDGLFQNAVPGGFKLWL